MVLIVFSSTEGARNGTYFFFEHRRLRQACAVALTRLSLRCSQTQRMDGDEASAGIFSLSALRFLRQCDTYRILMC